VRDRTFRDKLTSLAAPIHGKPKDQLTGDDVREQRRFRRLRRAAIAGLIVLTVIAVAAAVITVAKRPVQVCFTSAVHRLRVVEILVRCAHPPFT
jgi:hypothetical protein